MHRLLAMVGAAALMMMPLAVGTVAAGNPDWQPPRFEIGAFGGVMDFDAARHMSGEVYGGRFGVNVSPQLGFEGVVATSNTISSSDQALSRLWITQADMMLNLLTGSFTPYVSGGLGNQYASTAATGGLDQLRFDAGGGVKLWMSRHLGLRGDMRLYWGRAADDDRIYGDIMATVGLMVGVGSSRSAPDDADEDGVPDQTDHCPETPLGVAVDSFGCPPDTDRDGVADFRDRCPETTLHAWVDGNGCPTDDDADGVYDGIDRCLETPPQAEVDHRGCPLDSDRDGVYDGLDLCVETPGGTEVDERGCPVVKEIEHKLVLHSVNFTSGKADLLSSSYDALDEVAGSLVAYPEATMEIRGYADAVGSESLNLSLTQRRAETVREYLIAQGVDPSRLRARGYGEADPVAPNDTAEGRAMNRRVEFHRVDVAD